MELYEKFHVRKNYEQEDLFLALNSHFDINKVLYPGSYVHITPAFIFRDVVFNDMYKKLIPFYDSDEVWNYIISHKKYPEQPKYRYIMADYDKGLPIEKESFDLLISQYAGFVSRACFSYLKKGGILVSNDSHGDASMARVLPNYKFLGVLNRQNGQFYFSDKNLDHYFVPKKKQDITQELIHELGKGIAYSKKAVDYVFERIK